MAKILRSLSYTVRSTIPRKVFILFASELSILVSGTSAIIQGAPEKGIDKKL